MDEQGQQQEPAPEAAPAATETTEEAPAAAPSAPNGDSGEVVGSAAIRPIFLGNLKPNYTAQDVQDLFGRPIQPPGSQETFDPFPIDRVDTKRGYCFVFLKDAASESDKERTERFVGVISGM